ncbi:Uncharacterized protein dnl_11550 [Desulfonema limicola]|uniref:Uncharacterized protein n=1 Tax=Desulfonema limicola TaxID=45656 RepID=A0A975B502_9BACT|nr:hypothetical protein [Desulfonema limicola]QTA78908.1 Uncharacterized protein dnl_11550 [Desulfonema limicola]
MSALRIASRNLCRAGVAIEVIGEVLNLADTALTTRQKSRRCIADLSFTKQEINAIISYLNEYGHTMNNSTFTEVFESILDIIERTNQVSRYRIREIRNY